MKTAELENDETLETIEIETEAPEAEDETNAVPEEEVEVDVDDDSDEDEVVVSIGEESPPQEETRAPEWVRELRKSNREKERKIRELEAKLNANETETKPATLSKTRS